tara:strand:- start:636 stop:767 length:132 start_codon:yes stop_codon:yes gene_type:complete
MQPLIDMFNELKSPKKKKAIKQKKKQENKVEKVDNLELENIQK